MTAPYARRWRTRGGSGLRLGTHAHAHGHIFLYAKSHKGYKSNSPKITFTFLPNSFNFVECEECLAFCQNAKSTNLPIKPNNIDCRKCCSPRVKIWFDQGAASSTYQTLGKDWKTRINVGVGQKWHKCCSFLKWEEDWKKTLLLARNWVFTSYCMCQLSWLSSAIPPFSTLTIAHTLPRGTSLPHPDKISPSPLGAKLVISNLQISYNTVVISRLKVKYWKSCHFRYWQFSGKIIDSFMIANNLDNDDGSDGIVH